MPSKSSKQSSAYSASSYPGTMQLKVPMRLLYSSAIIFFPPFSERPSNSVCVISLHSSVEDWNSMMMRPPSNAMSSMNRSSSYSASNPSLTKDKKSGLPAGLRVYFQQGVDFYFFQVCKFNSDGDIG